MDTSNSLAEAYKKARYPLAGHGPRDLQVLKDVLDGMDGTLESDIYGKGKIIEDFQDKMASFLGKERAVFFPSGTMAQQIALRIWCDGAGNTKVAYHPLCHLEIHENDGLKMLHHIQPILIADETRLIELEDVMGIGEDISCLLLELPQREIGGQLPPYETLEAISNYCKDKGIKLHLDGARLLEILPYYHKTAAQVAALFDSVYVSFYKGVGGIAGAILAGDEDFIDTAITWKRRYGGDLISLYPYILSADYYFEKRKNGMAAYYQSAVELALLFNQCEGVQTMPEIPVSNMFHVHFNRSIEEIEPVLIAIYEATGVGITGKLREMGGRKTGCELSLGDRYAQIPKENLHRALDMLSKDMG